jgi:DNA-directed RNA polymerase specialized sigma24 family protein
MKEVLVESEKATPLTIEDDVAPKHTKRTEPIPKHKILREVFRHFTEFQDWVSATGDSVIEHGYFLYDEKDEEKIVGKVLVTISFWDLHDSLQRVAERKKEAVYYNVIKDMKQKDVAAIMGITTVSVGQYVKQAMIQMSEEYFAEGGNRIEYVQ